MNPPIKSRQPLSHEWRRHSLVRVRRPSWSGHTATAGSGERAPASAVLEPRKRTTQDDISW